MLSNNEIQIILKRLDKMDEKFEIIFERFNILQEILSDSIHRLDRHEKDNNIFFRKIDKRTKKLRERWKEIDKKYAVLETKINLGGKGLLSIP